MFLPSWLGFRRPASSRAPAQMHRGRLASPLRVEALEDRCLMSATLSIDDPWVLEGNSGTVYLVYTVSLSAPTDQTVTVDYRTADGVAKAKSDYQSVSGTLTFAPGETTKGIAVAIRGDKRVEDWEHFYMNLSGAVNAIIEDGQGVGLIIDDDNYNGGCHGDRVC